MDLGKLLCNYDVEKSLLDQVVGQAQASVQRREAERVAKAAADAAAAEAAAAEAKRAEGTAAAARSGAAEVVAGDDDMDDDELSVDAQYERLNNIGQAPAPEEGADKPSDDAVRAAFKRISVLFGPSAKKARMA